jgi:hypothetical protein
MAKNPLNRIAEALEMNNQLFREWIVLNRESIEQHMKMRAEIFPLEMEQIRLEIGMAKNLNELDGNLKGLTKSVEDITAILPRETPKPAAE